MSGESFPKYADIMLPLLRLIGQGHETVSAALPLLQSQLGLSDEQMQELLPSGRQARIDNYVHWARSYLFHAGLITSHAKGAYAITPEGRAVLAQNLPAIDRNFLEQFPKYREWRAHVNRQAQQPSVPSLDEDDTPEDQIDNAFMRLDADLMDELLIRVLSLTPARFERLIVDLLLTMGYGDGRAEMGQAIGKSGDGGIDGVVNEDKLGLDAVYIQAKRYAPDNTIGRPALQAFIGSMTGESATKGVFVTTSSFSKEARDYVRRVQQRVVLIDGDRLARLMIDHGVGVRVDKTYVLRSVDANFFDVT